MPHTQNSGQALRRSFEQLRLSSAGTLMRHEKQQTDIALAESAQARIVAAIDLATVDPTPERQQFARKELTESVSIVGNMAGLPPEAIQAKLSESLTLLHRGVVMRLLDADKPDAARQYFDANRTEVNSGTQLALEKALKEGGILLTAQTAADRLMAMGLPLNEAMRRAETDFSGEEERAVKVELASRYSYEEAARKDMEQKDYGSALLEVEQKGRVTAGTWAKLTDTHRAAVLNRIQAEARARRIEAQGRPVKTDWDVYLRLREQADAEPGKFVAEDLRQYVDRIGPAQLEQLLDLKSTLQRNANKPSKEQVSLAQQLRATVDAPANGIGPKRKGEFMDYVYAEVDIATDANGGKPLNFKQRQEIIDRALLQGPDPSAWLWGEKRMYQLTPDERQQFKPNAATDAPATEVQALNEALAAQGLPQTPANRLVLYTRAMRAGQ